MTQYAKAIVAALISFLGSVQSSWDGGVTGQEWIGAAVVGLIAGGAVFGVKNRTAP